MDIVSKKVIELKETLDNIADDFSIPQEKRVQLIIHAGSLICAIVAVQPLPFADLFILTPIQVEMVRYINRALGNPVGSNSIKEIISYLTGVLAWGVLAQQVILGLYKSFIPFLGPVTTIPLVYLATYGLGYAAKAILEARKQDQTISKDEIRRISEEAKAKALEELKIEFSLKGLKKEWHDIKARSNEFKRYKEILERLDKARYSVLTDETVLEQILNDRLQELTNRFSKYPNVELSPQVITQIGALPTEQIDLVEKHISFLQYNPNKVHATCTIPGAPVYEIEINNVGRMYMHVDVGKMKIDYLETTQEDSFIKRLIPFINKVQSKTKHLRNEEIRDTFHRAIRECAQELNIISPWMKFYVVNRLLPMFDGALQRGATIKILYGIDEVNKSGSNRSDQSDEVAEMLKEKFKKYGSLFRIRRVNTHYKLLICDESFHVEGSYNFLSFAGEFDEHTRDEGATYSEDVEQIRNLRNIYFNF